MNFTLPVETYSRSSVGIVSSANSAQKGHWKSEISYTVTGAVGLPRVRAAMRLSCWADPETTGPVARASAARALVAIRRIEGFLLGAK